MWVYNAAEIGQNACCVARQRFTELFPTLNNDTSPLVGNVNSVHYSYHSRAVFLFAGEAVYELVPGSGNAAAETGRWWLGITRAGPWYDIWYDICDVE